MYIDTHCHLNFKSFSGDLNEVIKRATQAGIEKIIIPGAKMDSSMRAVEIAQEYPSCFAAIGIHPHHISEVNNLEESYVQLSKLSLDKRVVAIGECGLDQYTYKNYPPVSKDDFSKQKELFEIHLKLASERKLPIIVHCREAFSPLLELLEKYSQSNKVKGVVHCFSGSEADLQKVLEMGLYVGFDGNITYKENESLRDLVRLTPLDRLLIETDAPYLSPEPFRRTRNEPAYLSYTVKCVAEIHQKPIDVISWKTAENASKLFYLP